MLKAPVNKILDHSLVDGPGNRTAIFFQKCNIACKYCHNPETQELCCNCKTCVWQCPAKALKLDGNSVIWNEKSCIKCDTCIKICPNHSSPKVVEMTVDEVFNTIEANLPFIRGITVSGGECSLYPEFLTELFAKCRNIGLTCLMDCNGTLPIWKNPVMEVCDGVMLDVKAWSDDHFFALTGAHNYNVKENLRELAQMEKLHELRIVCLDGWVDATDVIRNIERNVTDKVKENTLLKLISFRNTGVKGELEQEAPPTRTYMKELEEIAMTCGFKNVRII